MHEKWQMKLWFFWECLLRQVTSMCGFPHPHRDRAQGFGQEENQLRLCEVRTLELPILALRGKQLKILRVCNQVLAFIKFGFQCMLSERPRTSKANKLILCYQCSSTERSKCEYFLEQSTHNPGCTGFSEKKFS